MKHDLLEWAESIIALQRQANLLLDMLDGNVRYWAGVCTKAALQQTLEAMISDSVHAANEHGDNDWLDSKRQWARGVQVRFSFRS